MTLVFLAYLTANYLVVHTAVPYFSELSLAIGAVDHVTEIEIY
jgi:hypothetical protein